MDQMKEFKGFGHFWIPDETHSFNECPDDPKEYMMGELSFTPDGGGLLLLKKHPLQGRFTEDFRIYEKIDLIHGEVILKRNGKKLNKLVTLRDCFIARAHHFMFSEEYGIHIKWIFENERRFFHQEKDIQFEELYLDYSYLMQLFWLYPGKRHKFEYDFQPNKLQRILKYTEDESNTLRLFENEKMIIDLTIFADDIPGTFTTGVKSRSEIVIRSLTGKQHFDDYYDLIHETLPNFITFITGKESFPVKINGRIISAEQVKSGSDKQEDEDEQKVKERLANMLPVRIYTVSEKYKSFDDEQIYPNQSLFKYEKDTLKDVISDLKKYFTKWTCLHKKDKLLKMFRYFFKECRFIDERFLSYIHAIKCYMQYHFGYKKQKELYPKLYEKLAEQYEDILIKLFNSSDDFKWSLSLIRNYFYHEEVKPSLEEGGKKAVKKFEELKIEKIVKDSNLLREYCYRLRILLILCILIELEFSVEKIKATMQHQMERHKL